MLGQGSPGATRLLRLSRRALGSPAHVEPNRKRVRHRASSHRADPRRTVAHHGAADGLQARHGRRQDMASAEGREPVAQAPRQRQIPGRNRGPRARINPRRLITLSPSSYHSSLKNQPTKASGSLSCSPAPTEPPTPPPTRAKMPTEPTATTSAAANSLPAVLRGDQDKASHPNRHATPP